VSVINYTISITKKSIFFNIYTIIMGTRTLSPLRVSPRAINLKTCAAANTAVPALEMAVRNRSVQARIDIPHTLLKNELYEYENQFIFLRIKALPLINFAAGQ
jgi:hypothetical protein